MKKNIWMFLLGLSLLVGLTNSCFSQEEAETLCLLDTSYLLDTSVTDTSSNFKDSGKEEILDVTDIEIDIDNLPEQPEMTFAQKLKLALKVLKLKSDEMKDDFVVHIKENGKWYVLGVCFIGAGLITYYKIFR